MKDNNFVCKVINELIDDDYSVFIHNKKMVDYCGGWFDCNKREFVVAMKNRLGFETLIHEYSHYLQWKNKKRFYNKKLKSVEIVFNWIDGKFFKKNIVEEAMGEVIELEWDCEIGAMDIIRKYDLKVDLGEYAQAANAYLMFYNFILETRLWCKEAPYNLKIMNLMPTALQPLEFYKIPENLTDKLRKEYDKILK